LDLLLHAHREHLGMIEAEPLHFSRRNANTCSILSSCCRSDEMTQRSPCRSTNALQGNPFRRNSPERSVSGPSSSVSGAGSVGTGSSEDSEDAFN
jgi:hypothetical protein